MSGTMAGGSGAGGRLLAEVRVETARADSKAALLLGALSMAVGLFGGILAARGEVLSGLSVTGTALLWAGLATLAGSLVCLLLAVLPRYGSSRWAPGRPLTYFDDIRRAADHGLLIEALDATEADPNAGLLEALTQNSRIVGSKHRWIRAGLAAYCTGVVLLPTALTIR
ncbi:Pycsar system effector family protein [Streptomyces sp. NPDC047108]|uniref:Pycsar system effector family protein n=1 Tax=Streptomyces sp. NPDC047108 TaxID=3155025 RepID=UPI0033E60679